MLKLTLDTNCIIAAAQGERDGVHVDQLAELARAGRIMISVTSGFAVDQRTARPEFHQANLAYLATMPVLRVPGPFRFDMSFLNGEDVFIDEDTADLDKRLRGIILGGNVPLVASKKMNDVHHLTAHHMAGNDVFVTSDGDDMVKKKKRERLRVEAGIIVKTPEEAVALATASE
jgi:hypothetical protein